MNILIVGNGFDLSHYLPTKYDHFMDVMNVIEVHASESMSFDKLFSKCREDWFIAKTKEYYLTEKVVLETDQLTKIKNMLNENCWYKYFKNHVEEVKTWIDFEQKIEEVLSVLSRCFNDLNSLDNYKELFKYCNFDGKDAIKIRENDFKILSLFDFFALEKYNKVLPLVGVGSSSQSSIKTRTNVNPEFCYGKSLQNGFNFSSFLGSLQQKLEQFIEIFSLYLKLIIDKLESKAKFKIESQSWLQPDHIFSFNYTNTFQKFYILTSTEFLHGHFGENQNIVLGISDLKDESLKNLKAYGFTKYHQKLFKDTDYLFLDENSKVQTKIKSSSPTSMGKGTTFLIWGHSLDNSDQEYIKEIFELNDKKDIGVRVIIYHFDANAKFSALNNLLAILGKDKVEHWMKNKWLKFEPNPEIQFGI